MQELDYEVEIEVSVITTKRFRVTLSGTSSIEAVRKAYNLPVEEIEAGTPVSRYDDQKQTIFVLGTNRK